MRINILFLDVIILILSNFFHLLLNQLALQFFQTLTFGFGTAAPQEYESATADGAVNPERTAAAQCCVHGWERER